MRAMFSSKPALLIALLFLAVSPSWATLPVTGGSHYGAFASGSSYFDQCLAGTTPDACESLIATGNSITVNGQSDPLYSFVEGTGVQFGGSPGTSMEFNVIDLGALAASTSFSLPISLFGPSTSVFSCNYNTNPLSTLEDDGTTTITQLIDSGNGAIGNFCTAGLTSAPDINSAASGSFQTGPTYNIPDLFLVSPLVVTAPEPGSLGLLSLGLLALCGLILILKTRTA